MHGVEDIITASHFQHLRFDPEIELCHWIILDSFWTRLQAQIGTSFALSVSYFFHCSQTCACLILDRLEKLENETKSSTEKFNKLMSKWTEAKTKVIHQELRDDLRKQQQLCWQITEEKNKLINELQQVQANTHTCKHTHIHLSVNIQ